MKTKSKRRIIWRGSEIIEVILQAKFGRSTRAIQRETGLTPCQITYRLTKAKNEEGLPRGVGYRVAWRDGTSREAKLVDRMFAGRVRKEVRALRKQLVAEHGW